MTYFEVWGYFETSLWCLGWELGAEAVTGGCLAKPGRKPRKLQCLQSPQPAPARSVHVLSHHHTLPLSHHLHYNYFEIHLYSFGYI